MTGSESTPDNPLPPRPPGFHGRDEELAWLRGLWDDATVRNNGPRLAVIVAESGIGKTRLAQALYQQLSADPVWDPPESRYWPDAFQSRHDSLRVNPDLSDHHPAGPPRFLWLGMRWQPPNARNVEERSCPLPDVRAKLMAHVETAWNHAGRWKQLGDRVWRGIRRDGIEEALTEAAEHIVPFAGLFSRIVRGGAAALHRLEDRDSTSLDHEQRQQENAADELLGLMREVLRRGAGGGRPLPIVMLLDDAQWIDMYSLGFLSKLWTEASRERWPFLLIATHWEREWRELRNAGSAAPSRDAPNPQPTLVPLTQSPSAEVRFLGKAERDPLGAHLDQALPGLSAAQRALIVERSDGNFLTLIENIVELLEEPEYFENGTHGPLNPAGIAHIQSWESERTLRVKQRFKRLPTTAKKLLGLSSRLGQVFIRRAVQDFANSVLEEWNGRQSAADAIEECIDPLSILAQTGSVLTEFRDKVWHRSALDYFHKFQHQHEQALFSVLRRNLAEWVDDTFSHGSNAGQESGGWPNQSIDEARQVFLVAEELFALSESADWSHEAERTALQTQYLLLEHDARFGRREDAIARARHLGLSLQLSQVPADLFHKTHFEKIAQWIKVGTSRDIERGETIQADLLLAATVEVEGILVYLDRERTLAGLCRAMSNYARSPAQLSAETRARRLAECIDVHALQVEKCGVFYGRGYCQSLEALASIVQNARNEEGLQLSEELLERSVAVRRKRAVAFGKPEHPALGQTLRSLAQVKRMLGLTTVAHQIEREAIELIPWLPPKPNPVAPSQTQE